MSLSDDYKYVINLNGGYTGTLTVNNVAYTVINGTVNGESSIVINLRGYQFKQGFNVTATTDEGAVSGVYTLADYVDSIANGQNEKLDALLVALYNFTVEAEEYKAYSDANGLN